MSDTPLEKVTLAQQHPSLEMGDGMVVQRTTVLNGRRVTLETYQPGFRWTTYIGPSADTDSCPIPHIRYVIAGHFRVRADDGTEVELAPGDVCRMAPGHDGWVLGDEPCTMLDFE